MYNPPQNVSIPSTVAFQFICDFLFNEFQFIFDFLFNSRQEAFVRRAVGLSGVARDAVEDVAVQQHDHGRRQADDVERHREIRFWNIQEHL